MNRRETILRRHIFSSRSFSFNHQMPTCTWRSRTFTRGRAILLKRKTINAKPRSSRTSQLRTASTHTPVADAVTEKLNSPSRRLHFVSLMERHALSFAGLYILVTLQLPVSVFRASRAAICHLKLIVYERVIRIKLGCGLQVSNGLFRLS